MITIKDLASYVNLSPSTVSIVLKGNGDIRKIPQTTQTKILDAAQKLGYRPNMQAKILRGGISANAIITLFWASDIRINMLSRFINGIQSTLINEKYPCELQIKPYENNHLKEALSEQVLMSSNGMIICNPSKTDMDFLEHFDSNIPIVLYNRYSQKYSTVNMDDKTIGSIPASVFFKHKKKHPALLRALATFEGMNIRTDTFMAQTQQQGMLSPTTVTVSDSMQGGYEGALTLCNLDILPDCLFCTSDSIAIGALKAFHNKGIKIPGQIELISIGNGNPEQQEFSIPSLSVINLPMEEMASACLTKIYENLFSFNNHIVSEEFPINYIPRESCPN